MTPLFSLGGECAREDVEEAGTLLNSMGEEESGEVENNSNSLTPETFLL